MTVDEAVRFLGPAVAPGLLRWADLGAGSGTFTEALLRLLPGDGRVIAVDRDTAALARLERLAVSVRAQGRLRVAQADLTRPEELQSVGHAPLDGVLFANVLHFFSDPAASLGWAAGRLAAGGRLVVIEYEGRSPGPWVPHPLPPERLATLAVAAGVSEPEVVSERPSRYRGRLYCAVLERTREPRAGGHSPRPA